MCSEVQKFNPDAGTLSLNTIPKEISDFFNTKINTHFAQDLKKMREHGKYILKGIRSENGGFHIKRPELLTQLIESSEENNLRISNNLLFRQKVLSFHTLSSMYGDFQQLWSQPGISRTL